MTERVVDVEEADGQRFTARFVADVVLPLETRESGGGELKAT